MFMRCACCGAGAGNSPRRASHFLCFAKESNQRKATPLCASLRFATGNLRCSPFAGSAQTRFAQTRAALNPPEAALLGTHKGEWFGPLLRSACNGLAARGLDFGMGRSDSNRHVDIEIDIDIDIDRNSSDVGCVGTGSSWTRAVLEQTSTSRNRPPHTSTRHGALKFHPLCACRGAQPFADKGPRVSEPKASLRGPRERRAPQVARSEAEGRAQRGRLLLLTFLGETRKVSRPAGRIPGSGLRTSATPNQTNGALTPTLSQREREREPNLRQTPHACPPK